MPPADVPSYIRSIRADPDFGVFFYHLSVVEELYAEFVRGLDPSGKKDQFHLHPHSVPSRSAIIKSLLEEHGGPVLVEAPLMSAARILAEPFGERYCIAGATYYIRQDLEKCSLYYGHSITAAPDNNGIQGLMQTSRDSILTVAAQIHAKKNEWANTFTEPGTLLPMANYNDILAYAKEITTLRPNAWPIRVAFVLSGKANTEYLDYLKNIPPSHCWVQKVPDLVGSVFDEISGDRQKPITKVPGTVLLTPRRHLRNAKHKRALQAFVNAWYRYANKILDHGELDRWGFEPIPWTTAETCQQAIGFTQYACKVLGEVTARSLKSLGLHGFTVLFPEVVSSKERTATIKEFANLHLSSAKSTLKCVGEIIEVCRDVTCKRLAKDAGGLGSELQAAYEAWQENKAEAEVINVLSNIHLKAYQLLVEAKTLQYNAQPQDRVSFKYNLCGSFWNKGTFGELPEGLRPLFEIICWEGLLNYQEQAVNPTRIGRQTLLLSNRIRKGYKDLIEPLNIPMGTEKKKEREWMRKKILPLRVAMRDEDDAHPKKHYWILTAKGGDDYGEAYYLRLAKHRNSIDEFGGTLKETFFCLADISEADGPERKREKLAAIAKKKVAVPMAILEYFGLDDLWEECGAHGT